MTKDLDSNLIAGGFLSILTEKNSIKLSFVIKTSL
jgi:hypothetical protein